LVQISLVPLLFGSEPMRVYLRGGTNAEMAPQIDYTLSVLQPAVARFGAHFDIEIIKRGYYPRGGGEIILATQPVELLQPVGECAGHQLKIKISNDVNSSSRLLRGCICRAARARRPSEHHDTIVRCRNATDSCTWSRMG